MKYTLILGGGGFIGSNLVLEYIKNGKNVIIFNKFHPEKMTRFSDRVDQIIIINSNLSDINTLKEVFSKYAIEEVIHLISRLIPSSPIEDFVKEQEEVITPTIKLIEIMTNYRVRKLIYISSGGTVYGNYKEDGYYSEKDSLMPINYYGLSKHNTEEIIKLEGRKGNIDYLILRPSNPFGKFQNIYGKQGLIAVSLGRLINKQEIEIWGDGHSVRDYIPIENLCQCIIKLSNLNVKNEIYNIGSGVGHSVNEIIEMMESTLHVKFKTRYKKARAVDSNEIILNIDKMKKAIDVESIDMGKSILNFYNFVLEENDGK